MIFGIFVIYIDPPPPFLLYILPHPFLKNCLEWRENKLDQNNFRVHYFLRPNCYLVEDFIGKLECGSAQHSLFIFIMICVDILFSLSDCSISNIWSCMYVFMMSFYWVARVCTVYFCHFLLTAYKVNNKTIGRLTLDKFDSISEFKWKFKNV